MSGLAQTQVTSSAVCSTIVRDSSAVNSTPASRAALIVSATAPAALPVLVDPVGPSIDTELWPPNCVVFAPRKYVCTGAFEPRQAAGGSTWPPWATMWVRSAE